MAIRTRGTLGLEPLERRLVPAAVTTLAVHNDQPFARVAEPTFSGIPLPESLRLTGPERLRVLDGEGREVPAQFRVLGRWGGGPDDATRPIKWLEVGFAADVPARGTATYTLDDAGAGAASARMQALETSGRITVTTGPARFEIDRSAFNLFDTVWLDADRDGLFAPDERVVVPDDRSGSFVELGPTEYRATGGIPRSVVLEEAGPLRTVVRAEGFHAAAGLPLLRYVTRITFHAGQSHAEVDHTIIEGRLAGSGNGGLDDQVATTVARAGLRLALNRSGPLTATVRGGHDAVHRATLAAAGTAEILQEAAPRPAYRAGIGGLAVESGDRATRAWLGLADGRFGISVTTRDFDRKGPQRLFAGADGTLQVEFPATPLTIGQAMGLSERVVFWFHPAAPPPLEAERVLEGFGKDQLLALAPAAWMRASGALGEVPGELPARWGRVDAFLRESVEASLAFAASPAASGLKHYLDMPIDRFQALPRDDGTFPSPDGIAWGNSYWDPGATLLPQVARTGDPRLLERLLFPLARHFATTDMYDPDDASSFTSGIGGARGVAHRGLWTGEYHYLESLWDFYHLTGDRRAAERGLTAARTYAFHPQFALATDQGGFPTTGRTLSQKFSTMLDAWSATGDPALRAALDVQMQEFLRERFTAEGFVTGGPVVGTAYDTEQAFMTLLGIHDTVYEYFRLTGDPRAREFVVTVPQRIAEHHRVSQDPASPDFMRFHTNVRVTRSAGGGFTVTRTTPRGNSDDFFYLESYVALGTALARAWACGAPAAARVRAEELFDFAVPRLSGGLFDKPTTMVARRLLPGLALLADAAVPGNLPPVFDPLPSLRVGGGQTVTLGVRATDPEGRGVTYALAGDAPPGAAIDGGTGLFSWRPGDGWTGTLTITISATDGGSPAASAVATLEVTVTAVPPALAIVEVVHPAGRGYRAGEWLSWEIVCSQPVTVTGRPTLPVRFGTRPAAATFAAGSGTDRLRFDYLIRRGDDTRDVGLGGNLGLPDGAAIGSPAPLDTALPGGELAVTGVWIDTTSPLPSGRVSVPAGRLHRPGDPLVFTVRFTEPVFVAGVPWLPLFLTNPLHGSRAATYAAGSGSTTLTFVYAVAARDTGPVRRGIVIGRRIRGGAVVDGAGNPAGRRVHAAGGAGIVVRRQPASAMSRAW